MKTLIALFVLSISIMVMSSCGKSDSETAQGTGNGQRSADTSSPATNLVFNGNFELGTEKPEGWSTKNQFLNDVTGWDTEVTHDSTHSLKIENIGGTDAYWQGSPILLEDQVFAFEFSVWTRTSGVKDKNGKYQILFNLTMQNKDNTKAYSTLFVDVPMESTSWQNIKKTFKVNKPIVKIVPLLNFGDVGTVWFDNLSLTAVDNIKIPTNFEDIEWNVGNFSPDFLENSIIINGLLSSPYHYLFTLPKRYFGQNEVFKVDGKLVQGGILIGLLSPDRSRFIIQKPINVKGKFSALVKPPKPGLYIPIITADLMKDDLNINVEITDILISEK